jgi:hypothetical protein
MRARNPTVRCRRAAGIRRGRQGSLEDIAFGDFGHQTSLEVLAEMDDIGPAAGADTAPSIPVPVETNAAMPEANPAAIWIDVGPTMPMLIMDADKAAVRDAASPYTTIT